MGSYQAGVYEGLAEAGIEPTWISGISIGALNTAIIAGNAPEDRVEALRGFWNTICQPADFLGHIGALIPTVFGFPNFGRRWSSMWSATRTLTEGQKGFFEPRVAVPMPLAHSARKLPNEVSFYDTAALRATLLQVRQFRPHQ